MFTVEQIEQAHSKVRSGADFPKYIQEIKRLGVTSFETRVKDSHTEYAGAAGTNRLCSVLQALRGNGYRKMDRGFKRNDLYLL